MYSSANQANGVDLTTLGRLDGRRRGFSAVGLCVAVGRAGWPTSGGPRDIREVQR